MVITYMIRQTTGYSRSTTARRYGRYLYTPTSCPTAGSPTRAVQDFANIGDIKIQHHD